MTIYFTEFDDSSINFIVRFWIDMIQAKEELVATHQAIKLIRDCFRVNDINIPFPKRTLDFANNNLSIDKDEKKGRIIDFH